MPELIYKNRLPTPEEFEHDLGEAMAAANPVDDLLMLAERLRQFENKYNMKSDEFYQRYQAGVLNDELQHCVSWAATYNLFSKTKRLLEATLMRAAVQPSLDEVIA
jgi:hypothetical protein